MIGCALHLKMDEFALALLISWVGHLRLPSDLLAMTHKSLVKPSRFAHTKFWGLLLYPVEDEATSKAGLKDEGLMLDFEPHHQVDPALSQVAAQPSSRAPPLDLHRHGLPTTVCKVRRGRGVARTGLEPHTSSDTDQHRTMS